MSRPKCPMTETARPNRPDRIGQTETAQIEMAQTETAQTKTARPKRPDRIDQTENSCTRFSRLQHHLFQRTCIWCQAFLAIKQKLNHFKQNCDLRCKDFKSSELFSDLVNFFVNLVIFTDKPVAALAIGYAAGRRTIVVNPSDSYSKYFCKASDSKSICVVCFIMHFKWKVLKLILTHPFFVLVTVGLGHGVERKLYTLIGGQRAEKFENHWSRHLKLRTELLWGDLLKHKNGFDLKLQCKNKLTSQIVR